MGGPKVIIAEFIAPNSIYTTASPLRNRNLLILLLYGIACPKSQSLTTIISNVATAKIAMNAKF